MHWSTCVILEEEHLGYFNLYYFIENIALNVCFVLEKLAQKAKINA